MANKEDFECPQHQQIVTVWSDQYAGTLLQSYEFSVIKTDVEVLLNKVKVKVIVLTLSLKMSNLSILWTHVLILMSLYYFRNDDFYKTMYNKLGDTFS